MVAIVCMMMMMCRMTVSCGSLSKPLTPIVARSAMQISKLWSWSLTEMLMMTKAHDDDDDDDDDDDKPIPEGMRSRCMVHH